MLTPVLQTTGERIKLELSPEDMAKCHIRSKFSTEVTDLKSGKKYIITDKPCELSSCHCDAWATEIAEDPNISLEVDKMLHGLGLEYYGSDGVIHEPGGMIPTFQYDFVLPSGKQVKIHILFKKSTDPCSPPNL